MEKKHHIRERWSDLSRVFVTVKSRLYEKRKSELLLSLHCMASERCFLVELKRKYAGNKLKKLLCKIFSSMCILVIMVCSLSVAKGTYNNITLNVKRTLPVKAPINRYL